MGQCCRVPVLDNSIIQKKKFEQNKKNQTPLVLNDNDDFSIRKYLDKEQAKFDEVVMLENCGLKELKDYLNSLKININADIIDGKLVFEKKWFFNQKEITFTDPTGEWKSDKIGIFRGESNDGYGEIIYNDGTRYKGFFTKKKPDKCGKFISNDSFFIGNFLLGKATGFGIFGHDNGIYVGYFDSDYCSGKGIDVLIDETIYIGDFKNGFKYGNGRIISKNGDYYQGQLVNDQLSGYGVYSWSDNRTYKGHWKASKQQDYGVFQWPDGKIYEGNYMNGKINGKGKISWPDGRAYDGEWSNGTMNGNGIYWKDQNSYRRVMFSNGKIIKFLDNNWIKSS